MTPRALTRMAWRLGRLIPAAGGVAVLAIGSLGPPSRVLASGPEEWQHLSPAPPSPSGRQLATLTHDPIEGRMILFGGRDGVRSLNDAWSLESTGANSLSWTKLEADGTPPSARSDHVAVFDAARNRLVVFGGQDGPTQRLLNDVWFLEFGGARPRWTQAATAGVSPQPRQAAAGVYDPIARRLVLFAGLNYSSSNFGDTWSLDLASEPPGWTEMRPGGRSPDPRDSFLAAYDPSSHRMIVFGGMVRYRSAIMNDLHFLDLTAGGERWSSVQVDGALPMTRQDAVGAFDPAAHRLVVFGGWNGINRELDDLWAVVPWSAKPSWRRLDPAGGGPGPRVSMASAYDPATGRLIACCGVVGRVPVADVWGLKLSSVPSPTPPRDTPTPTGSATRGPTEDTPLTPVPSQTPTRTPSPTRSTWPIHLPRLLKQPRPTATATPSETSTPTAVPCLAVEAEPNDTRAQAGAAPPLCQGRNVEGHLTAGDHLDVYWVEVTATGTLDVVLYNPPNTDYDLVVYAWTAPNEAIGRSRSIGPGAEQVVVDVSPGRYYLGVWPVEGSSDVGYVLRWTAR